MGKKDKADKSKDKRDAEKKKKDKEKEQIKKKLKAGKDFKDKQKREAKAAEAKVGKERKPKGGKKGTVVPVDGDEEKDDEMNVDGPQVKMKDYEKKGGKERKTNKRYKDYEKGKGGPDEAPPPSS